MVRANIYRRRKLIPVLIGAVVILIGLGLTMRSRPKPQPQLECYGDQTRTMTIQEVADLFNTSLVELSWFPDKLALVPQISTYPSYAENYPELSRCYITINYVETNSLKQRTLVTIYSNSIGHIELTKSPTMCSWRFTPTAPVGTDCDIELDGNGETLRVSINLSSEFTPEDALRVLSGIRIVEPSKKTDDTSEPTPTPS